MIGPLKFMTFNDCNICNMGSLVKEAANIGNGPHVCGMHQVSHTVGPTMAGINR